MVLDSSNGLLKRGKACAIRIVAGACTGANLTWVMQTPGEEAGTAYIQGTPDWFAICCLFKLLPVIK